MGAAGAPTSAGGVVTWLEWAPLAGAAEAVDAGSVDALTVVGAGAPEVAAFDAPPVDADFGLRLRSHTLEAPTDEPTPPGESTGTGPDRPDR